MRPELKSRELSHLGYYHRIFEDVDVSNSSADSSRKAIPIGLLVGALLSLVFAVGFVSGTIFTRGGQAAGNTSDTNLRDFLTAYHLVTNSYYQPVDRRRLVYAAIDGMLSATGDPHTLFLSPSENTVADQQLNGVQFSGIGAIVVPDRGSLQVLAPLPHSPASLAGMRAGDIVVEINGVPVSRLSGSDAIGRIHGPAGSTVRLTIERANRLPFTLLVKRAHIPPITAYGRVLDHHLGYLAILSFGNTTDREVGDALALLQAQHVRGIVIDLRQNPGGYVDSAQEIASRFLSHGVVAYERGSDHHLRPLPLINNGPVVHLPLAVLVDSATASAAEITAGALQDSHRAVLVGTRTYGKGSMQSVYSLADGSSIRITDRLWLTPDKHSIQATGIRPDIAVAGGASIGRDPQLLAAEQYLQGHPRS
jgi:carboxyl-terminal processing protease